MTEINSYAEQAVRSAVARLRSDWMKEGESNLKFWGRENTLKMALLFAEQTLMQLSDHEREQYFVDAFRHFEADTRALAEFDSLRTGQPDMFSRALTTAWKTVSVELGQDTAVPLA